MSYRAGDVLRVSCPWTETRVTGLTREHVSVEWPWWRPDPDVDWIEWNGQVALERDRDGEFRTDPAPARLAVGDRCRIGMPPTVVHVTSVEHFDPPRETGRLPRPTAEIVVLDAGESLDPTREHQGWSFDLDDGIPMRIELLLRPYSFLEVGDEVADADARAWRFDGPWDWHPFDGGEPRIPAWPLILLTRAGGAGPQAERAVADATRRGSHADEVARWTALTRAEPVSAVREDSADE